MKQFNHSTSFDNIICDDEMEAMLSQIDQEAQPVLDEAKSLQSYQTVPRFATLDLDNLFPIVE